MDVSVYDVSGRLVGELRVVDGVASTESTRPDLLDVCITASSSRWGGVPPQLVACELIADWADERHYTLQGLELPKLPALPAGAVD